MTKQIPKMYKCDNCGKLATRVFSIIIDDERCPKVVISIVAN